jgi:PPOX class probable F420-dependent enzyme
VTGERRALEAAVRTATVDDAVTIARIRVASWRAAYAGIVPEPLLAGMDPSAFAERLASRLAGRDHGVLVAQPNGGDVEGFVIAGPSTDADAPGAGEINAIYLAPGARGRGVGASLLEAACAQLAERGFSAVVLWVLTANTPARRFYARMGFDRDAAARILDFDGTPIEEVRYRRSAIPSASMSPSPESISPEVRAFLAGPNYATLATVGPDGEPHQAVIWYRLDPDDQVLVNSRFPRRWPTELKREGRASVAITDVVDPFRWVGLQVVVDAIIDDVATAREDIVELAVRYDEADDESLARFRSQDRVSFRLRVLAVHNHLDE